MSAAAATKYQTLHRHKHKRRSTEIATIFPLFARSLSIPRAFLAFLAFSLQPPPEGGKNKTARQASQSQPGFLAPFARENGLLTAASWTGQPPSKAGKPQGRRCEEKNTVPTLQKGSEIKSLFLRSLSLYICLITKNLKFFYMAATCCVSIVVIRSLFNQDVSLLVGINMACWLRGYSGG